MKWTVGTRIAASFSIALALFVAVGVASYRSVAYQNQEARQVLHTQDVYQALEQLLLSLLSAESGQRGYIITGDEKYLTSEARNIDLIEQNRKKLADLVADNPRQQARADALAPLIAARLNVLRDGIEARRTQDFAAAQRLVVAGDGYDATSNIRQALAQMRETEQALLAERTSDAERAAAITKQTIIFGTAAALIAAALAGYFLTRSISIPLGQLTAAADRVTLGDLNATATVGDRSDEIGLLARSFERMQEALRKMANAAEQIAAGDLRASVQPQSPSDVLGNAFMRMRDNLRRQIGDIAESAAVLGTAASQIVASTAQLASGASESAAAVAQTTTTVEEIRQTAHMASQKAKGVAESAQRAARISIEGRKSTDDVAAGMHRIRSQMEAIAESMMRLSEQSHTIGQIIATVEDLAAQSNLLAVNAAIEAAKAGEHGKGFSVVAQEVKSLAEQSRGATDRVRLILGEIQKATTAAVLATEQGSKAVEDGVRQTETSGEAIQGLAGSIDEAAQAATQIAASSQQQLVGMDQVAGAMESIKSASTQNVASARQLESAAHNLNDLGQRLKQLVAGYSV